MTTNLDAPAGSSFIALLEALRSTGGAAPREVVSGLLQEHPVRGGVSLAALMSTRQLFGFEWRASLWLPMFQFYSDSWAVNVGAQRVRAKLPVRWSGWSVASWFAGPNIALDGRRPADLLDLDIQAVLRAARSQ